MLNAKNEKSPVDISKFKKTKLGKRLVEVVEEYEEIRSQERDFKYVAVRTRQAILRNGVEATIRNAVNARPSEGFKSLLAVGRPDLTYEWVALEFPRFKDVHAQAKARLEFYGLTGYPGYRRQKKPAARRARGGGVDGLTGATPTA